MIDETTKASFDSSIDELESATSQHAVESYLSRLQHHEIKMFDSIVAVLLHAFDECRFIYDLTNVFVDEVAFGKSVPSLQTETFVFSFDDLDISILFPLESKGETG